MQKQGLLSARVYSKCYFEKCKIQLWGRQIFHPILSFFLAFRFWCNSLLDVRECSLQLYFQLQHKSHSMAPRKTKYYWNALLCCRWGRFHWLPMSTGGDLICSRGWTFAYSSNGPDLFCCTGTAQLCCHIPHYFCSAPSPVPAWHKPPFRSRGVYRSHAHLMRRLYKTQFSAVAALIEIGRKPEREQKCPQTPNNLPEDPGAEGERRSLWLPWKAGAWVPSRGHTLPPSTQPSTVHAR